jgi:hypothetical protein
MWTHDVVMAISVDTVDVIHEIVSKIEKTVASMETARALNVCI